MKVTGVGRSFGKCIGGTLKILISILNGWFGDKCRQQANDQSLGMVG